MKNKKYINIFILSVAAILLSVFLYNSFSDKHKIEVLKKIVKRLEADTRVAQVIVTDVRRDPATSKVLTTIKFLEFDSKSRPLKPLYFTFSGNIIQFQSLVVRFDDAYIESGDLFRGKSAYLFTKVFFLDGKNTQVFDITPLHEVPKGYKIDSVDATQSKIEHDFWEKFWAYAFDKEESAKAGIKNAQIEAPGTKFVPGTLYTIVIEHDGGLRIDSQKLPEILKGERILDNGKA